MKTPIPEALNDRYEALSEASLRQAERIAELEAALGWTLEWAAWAVEDLDDEERQEEALAELDDARRVLGGEQL